MASGMQPLTDASPIVIMSYHHSGARHVQLLLTGRIKAACTEGTGILPLCHMGAEAFQRVESRNGGQLSGLAQVSLRSLATVLITAVQAEAGARRWCELAAVQADAAEAFLELFPAARFICVHRSCTGVIEASLKAHPWSIANGEFGRFPAAYPGNNVAALAAYWVSQTENLLAFEEKHGAACMRLRYEDLVADELATLARLLKFLDIEDTDGEQPLTRLPVGGAGHEEATESDLALVPFEAIPQGLRGRVTKVLSGLGYPEPTFRSAAVHPPTEGTTAPTGREYRQ